MKTQTSPDLSQRLRRLAEAAQAVAASDLDARVQEAEDDDLGIVTRAFNEMADQLETTINTLEDMIAQRTADLTESEERLRLLIEGVKDYAVVMLDTEGRIASWNATAEAITGYAETEVFGLPISIFYLDEDAEAAKADWALEMARESGRFEEEGWRVRKDGAQFWAEMIVSAIRDETGELRGFAHVTRDITEKNRVERANRLLLETTRAVSAAKDCDSALTGAVHAICKTTSWAFGEAWIPGRDGRLQCALAWHRSEPKYTAFHGSRHAQGFGAGESMVGRVWQTGSPEWVDDISAAGPAHCARRDAALAAGLRSSYTVPVLDNGETLAVLAFFNDQAHQREADLAEVVRSVVQQLGPVIRQKQASDALAAMNETLEARVEERTHELTAAVEEAAREVAERRRIEAVLRESDERTRTILDTAADAIITIDQNGIIETFNRAAVQVFGYEAQDVIGKNVSVLMPEPEKGQHDAAIKRYIETGERHVLGRLRETIGQRRNGELFPMELAVSEIDLHNRRAFAGIVRDITERKAAAEALAQRTRELEESNRELEDFTYVVSHDLKEPLRGIEGFSSFLTEDYSRVIGEEGRRYLANIRESTVRMKALIEDLLELSRIGRIKEEHTRIDVAQMIEEVRRDLEFSIREKGVDFRVQPDLPAITGEAIHLKEVFKNLISNAVKFSRPTAGVVEIGCEPAEGAFQFFVRDDGIGIDSQYHERIFQIFQRLNRREDYEGTGAGLAICKKVITSHGGRIWVESALGQGSTFRFTVPAAPLPEEDHDNAA